MSQRGDVTVRKLRPDEYVRLEHWSAVGSAGEASCWWGGLTLIAERNGQIVGFLEYFGTNVENIWVVPGMRGLGIGTLLLLTFAQLQPVRPLLVPFAPTTIVPFLEKWGFVTDTDTSPTSARGVFMHCHELTPVSSVSQHEAALRLVQAHT